MRIINLGSDPTIFVPGSAARARLRLQASAVEELHVISPAPEGAIEEREGSLFLHPLKAGKWRRVSLSVRRARMLIRTCAIDVVSAQDPFIHGLAALIAVWGTRARLNIQVHTDLAAEPLWRRFIARRVLRRADSIRVVSKKIKNDLVPLRLRAPITVLPIFVDLSPFRAMAHRAHPRFAKVILWVGRFEPEKDPLTALAILAAVRTAGVDAGLILLGSGSLEGELRTRARALEPWVEFAGWQDPKPYLACADVVVSTSLRESYGASIIEALAARVPVVAPDVGVAREAGAVIAQRTHLSQAVLQVLASGARGELAITPLSAPEWVEEWRRSLA